MPGFFQQQSSKFITGLTGERNHLGATNVTRASLNQITERFVIGAQQVHKLCHELLQSTHKAWIYRREHARRIRSPSSVQYVARASHNQIIWIDTWENPYRNHLGAQKCDRVFHFKSSKPFLVPPSPITLGLFPLPYWFPCEERVFSLSLDKSYSTVHSYVVTLLRWP